jgi:hypothetical protein
MRTVKVVFLSALVLLLLSYVTAVGAQTDSTPYLLPILQDGETVEDAFLTTSDAHLYAFQGTEGDVVSISLRQAEANTSLDPYLILLGEAGAVHAYNDDSESDKDPSLAAAIVNYELPVTGTYFVVATTFTGSFSFSTEDSADGPYGYVLSASGFTLPAGADPESFLYSGGSLEMDSTNTLYSNSVEPVYYVDFVGEAGQIVDIRTVADSVTDTVLWLFAPNGLRIAANDDSNGTAAELLGVELPEDGKYMIFATGYGFVGAADGSYTQEGTFDISLTLAGGSTSTTPGK